MLLRKGAVIFSTESQVTLVMHVLYDLLPPKRNGVLREKGHDDLNGLKLLVQRNTTINEKRNDVITLPWRLRLQ